MSAKFQGCDGDTEAHQIYTEFWRYFDEDYAVFDLRLEADGWDDIGRAGCQRIDDAVASGGEFTERQLFSLMVENAEQLDDGHVFIDAFSINASDDGWVNEYPFYDEVDSLEDNAEENYIAEAELARGAFDEFSWGTIGDVGYLSITSLEELDENAVYDENEDDHSDHTIDELAADQAMSLFLADMTAAGVSSIVVDIRANEGGWDSVALVVATWFAGEKTVAWSEAVRNGPGHTDFSEFVPTFVEDAQPNAFDGPVVLLTSGGTFSAAEVMMLAMRVRDNVTIMGERPSGHLSDQCLETLSNGWEIDLSCERYMAADGELYEHRGVPVDIEVGLDRDALAGGVDVMLDAAIETLAGQ